MRIEVDEERVIVLKNVYSGVILETEEGNKLGLCMRDDTFEGTITRASDKAKKNIRVDMESLSIEDVDASLIRDAMRYRLLRDEDNWGAESVEKMARDTEQVFKTVADWYEEDGCALFFKLDAGEPPFVTSPICSDWDDNYFTHWMPLPNEFRTGYRMACIKSGIETEY